MGHCCTELKLLLTLLEERKVLLADFKAGSQSEFHLCCYHHYGITLARRLCGCTPHLLLVQVPAQPLVCRKIFLRQSPVNKQHNSVKETVPKSPLVVNKEASGK